MIIGKGLLAKSLKQTNHQNHTLFCAGVSNSLELQEQEFRREADLLMEQNRNIPLFYFSTISIFNPSKAGNPYIRHKIAMEHLVARQFPKHLVVRLPNMVGNGGNALNLFPYFLHAIYANQQVSIHPGASRYILGVDALPEIIGLFMEKQLEGEINVCFPEAAPVLEMYLFMCDVLGKKPNYLLGESEVAHEIDKQKFLSVIENSTITMHADWKKIIKKYTLESAQNR